MIDHKDLEDLPLEEMSLYPPEHTPPRRSWRQMGTYMQEVHPLFRTIKDYRVAMRLYNLGHPRLREVLSDRFKN
jgi:hypothetical protein